MKKVGLIIGFLFLFSIFNLYITSADLISNIGNSIDSNIQRINSFSESDKWQYLNQQWTDMIMNNPYLVRADSLFKSINPFFAILFGQNYEPSLMFLLVVLLWILLLFFFSKILTDFSSFSKGISRIIAFALIIIAAQIKIIYFIASLIFNLIFSNQGAWPVIQVIAAILLGIIILNRIIGLISRPFSMSKQAQAKKNQEKDIKKIHRIAEGLDRELDS